MKSLIRICFLICITTNVVHAKELPKNAIQGSLIIGQNSYIDEILMNGEPLKLSKDGDFVFAIGRDYKETISITSIKSGEILDIHQIKIIPQDYEIQRIDGLPEQMVTPLDDEIIKRIISENNIIKEKKLLSLDETFFKNQFIQPTSGVISGVFGSQRILNGKAKSPHRGLDIAADEGTPIYACNDGIVIHAENDLYYTGGTIILDHGHGVKSIYAHMSEVKVNVNDKVTKDDVIGSVGSTGRSTGPHLHWGVMVFNEYVDPALLIK